MDIHEEARMKQTEKNTMQRPEFPCPSDLDRMDLTWILLVTVFTKTNGAAKMNSATACSGIPW
jgi:hypothetical protein